MKFIWSIMKEVSRNILCLIRFCFFLYRFWKYINCISFFLIEDGILEVFVGDWIWIKMFLYGFLMSLNVTVLFFIRLFRVVSCWFIELIILSIWLVNLIVIVCLFKKDIEINKFKNLYLVVFFWELVSM